MATISRTGIAGGSLISPTHITNIIDALDGTGVGITVVATGSFSGSLVGTATTASYVTTAQTASYVLQAVSASFAISSSRAVSSSFATTASYVANASSFPFTGSAIISGSLLVTGSLNVSGSARVVGTTTITGSINVSQSAGVHSVDGTIIGYPSLVLNLSDVGKTPLAGSFVIPNFETSAPKAGSVYWDDANSILYIYQESGGAWRSVILS
jgi:hypothetical protein